MQAYDDHLGIARFTPRDTQFTDCELIWLVHPDAVEGHDYDPERVKALWHITIQEDIWVVENNHDGVRSGATTVLGGVSLLRVGASFLVSRRTNTGPTLIMAAGALLLAFDLSRALLGTSAAAVRIAPPFEGEWLVLQGGPSRPQNHHLVAYNQRFALDLVRLDDGRIFASGTGNEAVHSWEKPLRAPADSTIVVARDDMEDSEGTNSVADPADAAGNVIVVELETGHFVVLAHLRHGTLRVSEGDRGRKRRSAGPGRKLPTTPPCLTFISKCRPARIFGIPATARCPSDSNPTAASWRATIASGWPSERKFIGPSKTSAETVSSEPLQGMHIGETSRSVPRKGHIFECAVSAQIEIPISSRSHHIHKYR